MKSRPVQAPSAALTERRTLAQLYRWAFLVRALSGLTAYVMILYTDVPFLEDALFYEYVAYDLATEWLSGRWVDLESLAPGAMNAQLLVMLIAGFYYLTAGVRALPVLFVFYSLITALVPVYVYRVTRELQAPQVVARRAGWLVALSPAFVFWSGSLYKEGLTLLFLSVAAYHTVRLQSGWRPRSVVITLMCILGLWGIRYYLAISLMGAVAVSLVWGRRPKAGGSKSLPVFVRQMFIVSGFAVLLIALGITERTERVLLEEENTGLLVNLDERRAGSASEAASGYLHEGRIDTAEGALQYFPLGLLYFLTVPFPWQVGAFRQNLIIPENVFWLALYPLIAVGIVRALKHDRPGTVFLLLMTGAMCAFYALLAANVGTAYRMRSQVWLLLAPFAAWGWEVCRERRRPARGRRFADRQWRLERSR
jgi:hypothetical protein